MSTILDRDTISVVQDYISGDKTYWKEKYSKAISKLRFSIANYGGIPLDIFENAVMTINPDVNDRTYESESDSDSDVRNRVRATRINVDLNYRQKIYKKMLKYLLRNDAVIKNNVLYFNVTKHDLKTGGLCDLTDYSVFVDYTGTFDLTDLGYDRSTLYSHCCFLTFDKIFGYNTYTDSEVIGCTYQDLREIYQGYRKHIDPSRVDFDTIVKELLKDDDYENIIKTFKDNRSCYDIKTLRVL